MKLTGKKSEIKIPVDPEGRGIFNPPTGNDSRGRASEHYTQLKEIKTVSAEKKKLVKDLIEKISASRTFMIASCRGMPGRQFHDIKKKLRGKAEVVSAKNSAITRAIDGIEKGVIKNLKQDITADIVLMFSQMDAFELSGLLVESQRPKKDKAGDIALENIEIEPGPTDLPPGPAISELGGVGFKVAVKEGKIEIIKGAIVAKKGEAIKDNVAAVLGKLNVAPLKVGFIPLAAYDSNDDAIYRNIIIDKKKAYDELREFISKAIGFAIAVKYPAPETIKYFIAKAGIEEKAIERLLEKSNTMEGK